MSNVAFKKETWQSSTYSYDNGRKHKPSALAVDGNADPDWRGGSCSQTGNENNPWWMVDLGQTHLIARILVTSRGDCDFCIERIQGFEVRVGNSGQAGGAQNYM